MPLTDTAIRAIKPAAKPVKHSDSGGLYLLQQPAGGSCGVWTTVMQASAGLLPSAHILP
jgi:hypothetical protein